MDGQKRNRSTGVPSQGEAVAEIISLHVEQLVDDGDEATARRMYGDRIVDELLQELGGRA